MSYDRNLVEHLMPTVFDGTYAYGLRNPMQADPDMPSAATAKSASNTLYACIADMRRAWDGAMLCDAEKRALCMKFGLGWTSREIANHEGYSRTRANQRVDEGVGEMLAFLEGRCDSVTDETVEEYASL